MDVLFRLGFACVIGNAVICTLYCPFSGNWKLDATLAALWCFVSVALSLGRIAIHR